jgi:hypothetical protein
MVGAPDRPDTSATLGDDLAEASAKFRDASNPSAEPFFALDNKDEVQHWEFVEGLHKHSVQSLCMVADTLVWGMSEAFEVSQVHLSFLAFYPSFLLGSDL